MIILIKFYLPKELSLEKNYRINTLIYLQIIWTSQWLYLIMAQDIQK